jgi:hypothetical protein
MALTDILNSLGIQLPGGTPPFNPASPGSGGTPPFMTAANGGTGLGGFDEAAYRDRMRRKREMDSKIEALRRANQGYGEVIGQQTPDTVGDGRSARINVAGRSMEHMNPVRANWAAPIGKMAAGYLGRKTRQKEDAAVQESDAEMDDLLMQTMGNDEEGKRLAAMSQMGIPGADRALAQHLAPKKEAMAGLLQFLSNGGDPAMAAQLAPQYGLDPATVQQAAERMKTERTATDAAEFEQKKALKLLGLKSDKPTEFELWQRDPEGYAKFKAAGDAAPKTDLKAMLAQAILDGDQAKIDAYTKALQTGVDAQGRRALQDRAKNLTKFREQLKEAQKGNSGYNIAQIEAAINDPKNFTAKNRIATQLSTIGDAAGARGIYGAGPITRAITTSMKTPGTNAMESFFMSQALKDMTMLGGSDSNEELAKIQSQYPTVMNSQEGARLLFENFKRWNAINERAIQIQMNEYQSTESYTNTDGTAINETPYKRAERELIASGAIPEKPINIDPEKLAKPEGSSSGAPEGWDPDDWKYLTEDEKKSILGGTQ